MKTLTSRKNLACVQQAVRYLSLKVVYVTLYPEKYPRVRKIATALKDENIVFQALIPRIRIRLGDRKIARLVSALISYTSFLLQIFFTHADLYWVANSPDIFVVPLIVKKANYILDYRGPWPLEIQLEFGLGALSRIAGFLAFIALKNAGVITLPSSTLTKDVQNFGKKVYVIPNYPLKGNFKPNVSYAQFRKQNDVKEGQKVILFVGMLSRVEGFDILPSIMEELMSRRENLVLWIVGDGVLAPLAQELERKFPKKVKFFGWRPYKEIPNFINATDVCIVPRHKTPFSNRYNEENVQKISEYMFFEKPIVACGIAPSSQYLLVGLPDMANGILQALEGKVPKPTPRNWEDECKEKVLEVLSSVES